MKQLTILIAMLMLAFGAYAKGAPEIKFAHITQEFGTLHQSDKPVEIAFEFENIGASPLVIVSANSSCGCTKPHFPDAPISPGEKGVITLKFNPQHQMGEVIKSVTVRTNDTKHKKVVLRITGTVVP